jgi:hypothetical protein
MLLALLLLGCSTPTAPTAPKPNIDPGPLGSDSVQVLP